MRYKDIKKLRDKYSKEIYELGLIGKNSHNQKEKERNIMITNMIKEKKKRYNFLNALLKTYNKR